MFVSLGADDFRASPETGHSYGGKSKRQEHGLLKNLKDFVPIRVTPTSRRMKGSSLMARAMAPSTRSSGLAPITVHLRLPYRPRRWRPTACSEDADPHVHPTSKPRLRLRPHKGDLEARELLARHKQMVRSRLAEHRGREIDSPGDASFVAFESGATVFDTPSRSVRRSALPLGSRASRVEVRC